MGGSRFYSLKLDEGSYRTRRSWRTGGYSVIILAPLLTFTDFRASQIALVPHGDHDVRQRCCQFPGLGTVRHLRRMHGPKRQITTTANALTKVAVAELKHNRGGSRRTNARSKPILASLFAVITPGVALTDEDITTLSAAYAHYRCFRSD